MLQKPSRWGVSLGLIAPQAIPLWRGVAFVAPLWNHVGGKGALLNSAGLPLPGSNLVSGSTAESRGSPYGRGVGISGASNLLQQDAFAPLPSSDGVGTGDLTMIVIANPISEALSSYAIGVENSTASTTRTCLGFNTDGAGGTQQGTFSFVTRFDGVSTSASVSAAMDGKYKLFGGVRQGQDVRAYINGANLVTTSGTIRDFLSGSSTPGIAIGQKPENTTNRINVATTIVFAAAWNRALSPAEMRLLARDPFIMFRPAAEWSRMWAPPSGGSVNLTAQTITVSQGTVDELIVQALTAQTTPVAQGLIVPAPLVDLSGQPLTIAQGSVDETIASNLTTQTSPVVQGAIDETIAVNPTAQTIPLAQGNVTGNVGGDATVNITAQTISVAQGNIDETISTALTTQTTPVIQGSVNETISANPLAQTIPAAQGSVDESVIVNTGSQAIPLAQGNVTGNVGGDATVNITAQTITTTQGDVSENITTTLTTQNITATQTSVNETISANPLTQTLPVIQTNISETISTNLAGQTIPLAQGNVTGNVGGDATVNISGQTLSVNQGAINYTNINGITTQSIAVNQGNTAETISTTLSNQNITTNQGIVTFGGGDVVRNITLQQIGLAQGTLTVSTVLLNSQTISLAQGSVTTSLKYFQEITVDQIIMTPLISIQYSR